MSLILAAGIVIAGCSKKTEPPKETNTETKTETQAQSAAETEEQATEAAPETTEVKTGEAAPETEEAASEAETEAETEAAASDPLSDLKEGAEITLGSYNGEDLVWVVTSSREGLSTIEYASSISLPAGVSEEDADEWLRETFRNEAFDEETREKFYLVHAAQEPADGQVIPELVIWDGSAEDMLQKAEEFAGTDEKFALWLYELAKAGLPESEAPYLGRINILKNSGRTQMIVEEASLLNEKFGINEEASLALIEAYMQLDDPESAAEAAKEAAEAGFESAKTAFEQYGADAFDAENYEYALQIYELAGNQEKVDEINAILNPFAGLEVGDTFTFGSYEQNNDISDGSEPVTWVVMAKEGDKLWMISQLGLDAQPFNRRRVDVTWADCTLRTWLNEDFLTAAFTEDELAWLLPTTHKDGTEDKVYLLGRDEAEAFFAAGNTWKLKVSDFAKAQGVNYNNTKKSASWLLRTPGTEGNCVSYVSYLDGTVQGNSYVNVRTFAVRPVICVGKEAEE